MQNRNDKKQVPSLRSICEKFFSEKKEDFEKNKNKLPQEVQKPIAFDIKQNDDLNKFYSGNLPYVTFYDKTTRQANGMAVHLNCRDEDFYNFIIDSKLTMGKPNNS